MRLSMDEIVNAVCLNLADRHQVPVESIQVELLYDEDNGFSAEVWVQGRSRFLVEANLKEAIVRYMETEYGRRVYPSQITLDVEDEMWADIAD
ncbi:DUF2653 family protein [Cohnella sp. CFH 77786]|uniref:DUF2653 family protein n=1 Tax=Cohnella sp. CFH 77786 TaxID=2662265 RepID=UPI001C60DF6B|nr:DUF2653 family protein [Cohnella sp. CFH 77786]MBW5446541.1 DUF2653 family protein [Cohnella sp. CFH 77786]